MPLYGIKGNKCFEAINTGIRGWHQFGSNRTIPAGESESFSISLEGLDLPDDEYPVIAVSPVIQPGETFKQDIVYYTYLDSNNAAFVIVCQNNTESPQAELIVNYVIL